jgi:putative ABC transport system substrate-binding protein
MKRRSALAAIGIAAALPFAARAQGAGNSARIGVLCPFAPADSDVWHKAFRQGMRDLGWVEGSNLAIEMRFADGDASRLPGLAAELLSIKVDLMVTEVTEASEAARRATSTVPIVMVAVGDPVANGLVASLARPGGNITGFSQNLLESISKRLQMLKLMVPELTEVAALWNPDDTNSASNWRELQTSAVHLGLQLKSLEARNDLELGKVFDAGLESSVRALYVAPAPLLVTNLARIAGFAAKNRLASIFHLSEFAQYGGLLAYGPDRSDLFRRAASYVDKILKGAKPADLPVEQPTKFELAVNLRTAKALGLTVPPLILAQADEVIE